MRDIIESQETVIVESRLAMRIEIIVLVSFLSIMLSTTGFAQNKDTPFYSDRFDLLTYSDEYGRLSAVKTPADWQKRRAHIVANTEATLGKLPDAGSKVPLDVKVLEEVKLEKYTRKLISYAVDKTDRVQAYLLIPHGLKGKAPAMLALHPTTQGVYFQYAKELAQRGYVCLAPDYWPFGNYRQRPNYNPHDRGYDSAAIKGVWNHIRSIDLLETLPEVDADRIGCIGFSLGGYNTVFLSVFEPRLKVSVSAGGFCSFADYAASPYGHGNLHGWSDSKHIRPIRTLYNDDPKRVPIDFPEMIGAFAPRPYFICAPTKDHVFPMDSVIKCVNAARQVYELLGAKDNLIIVNPESKHSFPPDARKQAYDFIDKILKN